MALIATSNLGRSLVFKKSKVMAAFLVASAPVAFAGAMADIESSTSLLLEVGGSYSNVYYKDNVYSPESRSTTNPKGVTYNPGDFMPNNFTGGYLGLSLYRNSWLMNMRYDMYALTGKLNVPAKSFTHIAPEKMSFTLDKTWQTSMPLVVGLGGGVVLTTYNEAELFIDRPLADSTYGKTFHGRSRMAPLVEALAMYKLADNVNLKFNVAYQFPVNEAYYSGALNANLGINYAIPF